MENKQGFSLKAFIHELRGSFKGNYNAAVWPMAGFTLLFVAIAGLLAYFLMMLSSSMMMNLMMVMYGMASAGAIGMAVLEILAIFILMFFNWMWYAFMQVAFNFSYLDQYRDNDRKVGGAAIWQQFKRLNKNQVLRIALYIALFSFLWTLPLNIVGGLFAHNRIAYITCQLINDVIVIWKAMEYSQAYFVYKDKQPEFLGQSMRHALTGSRRFMGGLKRYYLLMAIVVIVLPLVIWLAIFGGLGYYGIYTATTALIYIGFILAFLGVLAYVPVMANASALFYYQTSQQVDLDHALDNTFKPVSKLTGQDKEDK